jgi:RNA polymerase sigma-70 factor (ECF subfamily)
MAYANPTPAPVALSPNRPQSDLDDLACIQATLNGQRSAFSQLVNKYHGPIYNLCYRKTNNPADADDAAQETFIRAYFKLHTYDQERKFSTWLFTIAAHCAIDKLRQRRTYTLSWDDLATEALASDTIQPEALVFQTENQRQVQQMVQALPPSYRQAIILKYWQNLSYQEMAQQMDTSVGAIKNRLFRARRMLAQTAA